MHSKIDLYKQQHSQRAAYSGNSLTHHLPNIKRLIDSTKSKTALDYGCGKAENYLIHRVHLAWGLKKMGLYDPAIQEYNHIPGDNFDCVISTDVLEHVPELEMNDTLNEIFSLSNKCTYLNIAMYPARTTLSNGENAHCTLKPITWWREKIKDSIKENIEVHVVYSHAHGNKNIEYEIYKKV